MIILAAGGAAWKFLPSVFPDVKEVAGIAQSPKVEYPELTVTIEEPERYFYYSQLGEDQQLVYCELLQGVENMTETIPVHAGEGMDTAEIYRYLIYDRPELFWCDGSTRMTIYETYTEVSPGYTCTKERRDERQAQIESAAQMCLEGMSAELSEYEKIKYIYEYIVYHVDYDLDAPDNQNIYSALVGGSSVCAGYSRAMQYLLDRAGIEAIYVTGQITGQGSHAWNIVKCDGSYYQADVTFADPVFLQEETGEKLSSDSINYDYLCCTDAEILTDHVPDDFVVYPVCDSDDLNYYKINGMYYETFDSQLLLQNMNDSIYAGEDSFVCKFASEEIYGIAEQQMIDTLLPQAAQNLASAYGLEHVTYSYTADPLHHKITMFWNYQ